MAQRNNLWANIDWWIVLLFGGLMLLGWINIYAALYNEEHKSIFDVTQRYGKQLIWIGAALIIGLIILLIDTNFYLFFSYPIYGLVALSLVLVLLVGVFEILVCNSRRFTIAAFRVRQICYGHRTRKINE